MQGREKMTAITVNGLIATTPRQIITPEGRRIFSCRLAEKGKDHASWFNLNAFDELAVAASNELSKGDRIIVTGELRVREWDSGETSGITVEITATNISVSIIKEGK